MKKSLKKMVSWNWNKRHNHYVSKIVAVLIFGLVAKSWEDEATDEDQSLDLEIEEIIKSEKAWITGNITFPEEIMHTSTVKIGSFNMKQYGAKKAKKEEVLEIIGKIVSRYDLIALQEITDVKGRAVQTLIETVNKESTHPYQFILSPRVGRTKQKEQYGLFYRPSVFQVKNYLVFNDSIGDPFSREPLIAEAILKQTGENFGLINVHIAPRDAPSEIDALADVHSWVENRMRLKNIMIVGDLNADCDYIRKKDIPKIRLMNDYKYNWLIPNGLDTTVGNTNCAYDRIIVSGPYFLKNVDKGSAQAFQFDKEYNLERTSALRVSDHYPVEISILVKSAAPSDIISSTGCIARAPSLTIILPLLICIGTIFCKQTCNPNYKIA